MMRTLLVANRGEIAARVIRTAHRLGMLTVAVYSDADADLPFVADADFAVRIGPPPPAESYLNREAVLAAAAETGADAIHPGYGFLSENADFAEEVMASGLLWVGPPPTAMRAMSDKIDARNTMAAAGVPVAPGSADPVDSVAAALAEAEQIGYPVMIKASAGGGGIGMARAHDAEELRGAYDTARTRAERFFSHPALLVEKYVANARHIEVQILGLADGTVVALGERDCSVQRRHQKVAEESPSPAVGEGLRERLAEIAVAAGEAVGYRNAGTVELLLDVATGEVWFLEMNTRLQVEHPVTEMVTGLDLVEEQLRIAQGLEPTFGSVPPAPSGHALEMRVYAEDPVKFLPRPGAITRWEEPSGEYVRVDAGYRAGVKVTPFYDPLLAKLVVWGATREQMLARGRAAVAEFHLEGPKNNLPFFAELLADEAFVAGDYTTSIIDRMRA
ncbi:MAG: ATP-grasp domain-containing protein [Actinobacteria bacterium]|nr:ATP-grasp domain-containing protein [Actinomycetota bacterium]